MSSLLDHLDRFSYTAQAIQSSARRASSTAAATPYVRAVLHTPLGDLARDVDASELGLFTLVPHPDSHGHTSTAAADGDSNAAIARKNEIARVEFPGATPLRRPHTEQGGTRREKEPEVYAEAAMKYLDRYQSIRPMPRARQEVESIIERLRVLRNEIAQLNSAVDQSAQSGIVTEPTARDEEKRIQELHFKIKQMKARKEVLLKKQKFSSQSTGSKASKSDDKEEADFWSEPNPRKKARQSLLIPKLASAGVGGRAGADDSLLLDAHIGSEMGAMGLLGDVSMDSLADAQTPLPAAFLATRKSEEKPALPKTEGKQLDPTLVPLPSPSPSPLLAASHLPSPPEILHSSRSTNLAGDDADDEDERTIILEKPPAAATPPPVLPSSPSRTMSSPRRIPTTPPRSKEGTYPETPGRTPGMTATPGTGKKAHMKITTDVERIAAKIWSTVGDVIMPGHPFSTAAAATTNKPPRAKETIALLQNLSSKTPPPPSPATSHSSFSLTTTTRPDPSQPTAHQILTAHLLLALLAAAPNHAMPLAQAKATLAATGIGASSAALSPLESNLGFLVGGQALETRALYGCVAKRLLKIDRSGREQIVKFNL
ncbi:hypothetical protein EW145_g2897 [Phellinidium pouzarii]|uniref:Uncharacterized protein n=1 Tax=Phellinidium pouzarii TaxID=167371 RepID=A0A4S4LEN4_9AGAM|nr:hypothetical protein EW145_g2897 [Phellinidium pouzarii]